VWPKWLRVQDIPSSRQREASMLCRTGDLQQGESQAIILSRITNADWLLTDDLAARVFAKSLGIQVHGSLGVVLWNTAHELISGKQAVKAVHALTKTSMWLSSRIIAEALAAIDDIAGNT
jgi:predicted nucleic acid-binding protein